MKTSFDYVPEMAKSELYLEFQATVGKKTVTSPAVKVADGVISTSEMLEQTWGSANPANGDDAFQRISKEMCIRDSARSVHPASTRPVRD